MMKLLASVVLAAMVCATFAQTLQFHFDKVPSSPGPAQMITVPVGNAYQFLLTTNTTNTPEGVIHVCIQRGVPPPAGSDFSKCTIAFSTSTNGTLQPPAPFTANPVFEGTYYAVAMTSNPQHVSLNVQWTFLGGCTGGDNVWTPNTGCAPAMNLNATSPALYDVLTTAPLAPAFFYSVFPAPVNANGYPAAFSITYEGPALREFNLTASFGTNNMTLMPVVTSVAQALTDAVTYSYRLPSAAQGTWYFAVSIRTNSTGIAKFSLVSAGACNGGGDAPCTDKFSVLGTAATDSSTSAVIGAPLAYYVYNGTADSWRVGISTQMGSAFNPDLRIYIAKGYLPVVTASGAVIADWTGGCTLPAAQCAQVSTIELSRVSPLPYFIALSYVNNTAPHTAKVLLWASTAGSPCPPCNRGSCPSSQADNLYGTCKCTYGWGGVDCGLAVGGFKIQIIVVIIIGGLLLITAIIGLVAWIISKRKMNKSSGYERV